MRKHMKVILWIVVGAFVGTIFFVWGMGGNRNREIVNQQSAAVVNGIVISYTDFERLWQQQSQELFASSETEPTREQVQRLRGDLITDLIDRTLLRSQFEKLGLKVFPEEVAARIAAIPSFQDQGRFSQAKYLALLQYNRLNPDEFEADQIHSLQIQKMEFLLRSSVVATESQLRAYALSRARELKLAAVDFNWKNYLSSVTVAEEKVAEYFAKNRAQYDEPAEARASHILIAFPENASEEQKLTAKLKIENLRAAIVKGEDFAAVAKKESQDPGSADKGGDLGYFKQGMMVPEFEKAAFTQKIGELSQPIATQYGYHLIKVTARKEAKSATLAGARPKILETLKGESARLLAQAAAKRFMEALKNAADLPKAAQAAGVKLVTTDWVKANGALPGIAPAAPVLDRAFDLPVGRPSSGIAVGEGMAFVQVLAEKVPAFDEADFLRNRETLLEKYKSLQAEAALRSWLAQARAEGKIINNVSQEKLETEDAAGE